VGTNPDGFVDRELVVVRLDDAQGKPYAVLVNFQCHGTVLTYENKLISPDWIGMARKTIERAMPGVTALYLQGAAGNQGPLEGGTGDIAVAHRLARFWDTRRPPSPCGPTPCGARRWWKAISNRPRSPPWSAGA
jgi:hypothetical protein